MKFACYACLHSCDATHELETELGPRYLCDVCHASLMAARRERIKEQIRKGTLEQLQKGRP